MTDKPKRPWFRFHLMTAVLMMFLAGIFIWLNISNPQVIETKTEADGTYWVHLKGSGWPLRPYDATFTFESPESVNNAVTKYDRNWSGNRISVLVLNALLTLPMLVVVAFFSESIIRHRSARKP